MTLAGLLELYRYNAWAHRRLLDVLLAQPAEALTRDLGGSFRCLRDVVAHVAAADWFWLHRWKGVSPPALPEWFHTDDAAALVARLEEIQAERDAFLRGLTEDDLAGTVSFRYLSGKEGSHRLGDLLFHVVNHSTYHRGQIASMLRQVGAAPPGTDFVVWKAEKDPPHAGGGGPFANR